MNNVRPKKYLGQHFLKDQQIGRKIVKALTRHGQYKHVIEIGPGMGVLTQFLLQEEDLTLQLVEIDRESVAYLKKHYPGVDIIEGDFLKLPFPSGFSYPAGLIGNFPYNISSQIFFKILDNRDKVCEVVGMVQKEVAERLASPPGSKQYGILSVLLQAFYSVEYLFTVPPQVFVPPPKVQSAVIRLRRNEVERLACDENLFFKIVKQSFQTRRKTLRNALKALNLPPEITKNRALDLRAEQLSVQDFVELTGQIQKQQL